MLRFLEYDRVSDARRWGRGAVPEKSLGPGQTPNSTCYPVFEPGDRGAVYTHGGRYEVCKGEKKQ